MKDRPGDSSQRVSQVSLISPDYRFEEFCLQMIGKDPLAVIDAAGVEAAYVRAIRKGTAKEMDYREEARSREYCQALKLLAVLLVKGSIPPEATPFFLSAAKPLLAQFLQHWEVGNLRSFLPLINDLTPSHGQEPTTEALEIWELPNEVDPLGVVVSREEVETLNTEPSLDVLRRLTASPAIAKRFFERVDIAFHGYDDTTQELFEIPPVREFVRKLDEQFPFWLFFLSKHYLGLQCLLFCFLPPFLTDEGRSEIFPERIGQLLTRRWIPAMNLVCEYVMFSEKQTMELTDRVMAYVTNGRFPLDE